jgi:hypothetical protein
MENLHKKTVVCTLLAKVFAIAAVCAVVSGCAGGPQFAGPQAPEPGKSNVFIYRGSKFLGVLKPYDVLVDDVKIGSLHNASYLKVTVKPGQHTIKLIPAFGETAGQRVGVSLDIAPEKTLYLRLDLQVGSVATVYTGTASGTTLWASNNALVYVAEAVALTELAGLNAAQ